MLFSVAFTPAGMLPLFCQVVLNDFLCVWGVQRFNKVLFRRLSGRQSAEVVSFN